MAAFSSFHALQVLLQWCDSVEYVTVRGTRPCLLCTFVHSCDFFRWHDYVIGVPLTYSHLRFVDDRVEVSVPVMEFFSGVVNRNKWRVSNRRK